MFQLQALLRSETANRLQDIRSIASSAALVQRFQRLPCIDFESVIHSKECMMVGFCGQLLLTAFYFPYVFQLSDVAHLRTGFSP